MDDANKWLEENRGNVSGMEYDLLRRCAEVLYKNIAREEGLPWSPYRCITPGRGKYFRGIWNWDTAFHAMAVSRWDVRLAEECILGFAQFQLPDGMFPDVIFKDGRIEDRLSKPPVLPWATEIVYKRGGNREFIEKLYPRYVKNERFWCEKRCDGGLFYYDAADKDSEEHETLAMWESGWDNSVRWDGSPIYELWTVDLNCYMVMFYRSMANLAEELSVPDDAQKWREKEKRLTALIEERLWDDEIKGYTDVNRISGAATGVFTPACFMPLYVGIAPRERAEYMNSHAADKNKFFSGMPTAAYDEEGYSTDYWRGPTWLNVAYFAAKGLKNYGFETADEIKKTILSWCDSDKRGIFENYDSKTGKGLCCDSFSWSAAFIIEFILNF